MWRKTRSATNGACRGVDPNRNWGHRWGGEGASTSPCAETYRGPRPFSEPETAAIRDFIMSRNSQIQVLFITFKAFFIQPSSTLFLKMGQPRSLFRLFSVFFKQTIQFLQIINLKMSVHPVYVAGI